MGGTVVGRPDLVGEHDTDGAESECQELRSEGLQPGNRSQGAGSADVSPAPEGQYENKSIRASRIQPESECQGPRPEWLRQRDVEEAPPPAVESTPKPAILGALAGLVAEPLGRGAW